MTRSYLISNKDLIIYFEEGNGTPLQYFCLENPMDRGAWWTAVYGVAQSRTRLKQLSSSSMNINYFWCLAMFVSCLRNVYLTQSNEQVLYFFHIILTFRSALWLLFIYDLKAIIHFSIGKMMECHLLKWKSFILGA